MVVKAGTFWKHQRLLASKYEGLEKSVESGPFSVRSVDGQKSRNLPM